MLKSQKGLSTIEMIPLLLIFALLFNFTLGFFGVIHTGVLQSIAARNYAFETFRNRADLTYLRDTAGTALRVVQWNSTFKKEGFRIHGVESEGSDGEGNFYVARRPIKFASVKDGLGNQGSDDEHRQPVRSIAEDQKASEVFSGKTPEDGKSGLDPVWIQVLYGICMNAKCKAMN